MALFRINSMTEKFHVNPSTGKAAPCAASIRSCPHGGDDAHGDNPAHAIKLFEEDMEKFHAVSTVKEGRVYIKEKYPSLESFDLYESKEGYHTLSLIRFAKEDRNKGDGSRVMKDLIELADKNNWPLALSPSTDMGATSLARLKKFYKKFGFVENKGRNKDYSTMESMIRPVE